MPDAQEVKRATLQEIKWTPNGQVQTLDRKLDVQFNPQSLKVSYANQKAGGNQRGGGAIQFVGQGTTTLSLDLLFDVTVPLPGGGTDQPDDVRRLVEKVAYFISPKKEGDKYVPPGIRFIWGSFLFEGVVDSINETLEFFSSDGRPLRATVSLSMSRQDIKPELANPQFSAAAAQGLSTTPSAGTAPAAPPKPPGTQPQEPARQGESVQQMAARQGQPEGWKAVAAANDIENPRRLPAGTLLDLSSAAGGAGPFGGRAAGRLGAAASGRLQVGSAGKLNAGVAGRLGFGAASRSGSAAAAAQINLTGTNRP